MKAQSLKGTFPSFSKEIFLSSYLTITASCELGPMSPLGLRFHKVPLVPPLLQLQFLSLHVLQAPALESLVFDAIIPRIPPLFPGKP